MSESPQSHSFPKGEKLTHKRVFEQLFNEGAQIRAFPLQLRYVRLNSIDKAPIKVAVTAPKRKFKQAVQRNRIKRMVREAYRRNKPMVFNNIEGNFAFLFLYLGNKVPVYLEVEQAMKQLLQDFLKKESHEKNV
ncbi:ribonuclease P protein component [Flagellimonas allohymeniacidonis]|uniref:Ribonuclease P protein component n=1 Tax=Flagellimonas allohymeniacidonis TaxID=2517819 RepID=A0A4Q8QD48_9FLAO|nr:ribonuclease P protein component [Allomuricauda hymeniacidonis]TAI47614.1 ribonuclease P protein component [Allomuricauda hymeniacidonis]